MFSVYILKSDKTHDRYVGSRAGAADRRSGRCRHSLIYHGVILALVALGNASALAQDPSAPTVTPTATATSTTPRLPEVPVAPVPPESAERQANTIHPRGPIAPELSQLDEGFKQAPETQIAQEYRLHLAWRGLQNRIANEPEIVAAKNATRTAPTDLEKRARVREYYNILYGRMISLADTPELKNYLNGKKAAAIAEWGQPRVRPETSSSPAKERPSHRSATPAESSVIVPPPPLPEP